MTYIVNTSLDAKKPVHRALYKIFGLGDQNCKQICDQLGIGTHILLDQLNNSQIDELSQFISQNYETGANAKRSRLLAAQRLIRIGCYRGFRHSRGLPVRGQRTHGNARTARKCRIVGTRVNVARMQKKPFLKNRTQKVSRSGGKHLKRPQ